VQAELALRLQQLVGQPGGGPEAHLVPLAAHGQRQTDGQMGLSEARVIHRQDGLSPSDALASGQI